MVTLKQKRALYKLNPVRFPDPLMLSCMHFGGQANQTINPSSVFCKQCRRYTYTVEYKMECIVHVYDEEKSELLSLNEKNWTRLSSFAGYWISIPNCESKERFVADKWESQWSKSVEEVSARFGFHRRCYSRFTNLTNLSRKRDKCERQIPPGPSDVLGTVEEGKIFLLPLAIFY